LERYLSVGLCWQEGGQFGGINALMTPQEGVQWRMDTEYGTAELKVLKLRNCPSRCGWRLRTFHLLIWIAPKSGQFWIAVSELMIVE